MQAAFVPGQRHSEWAIHPGQRRLQCERRPPGPGFAAGTPRVPRRPRSDASRVSVMQRHIMKSVSDPTRLLRSSVFGNIALGSPCSVDAHCECSTSIGASQAEPISSCSNASCTQREPGCCRPDPPCLQISPAGGGGEGEGGAGDSPTCFSSRLHASPPAAGVEC